MKLGLFDFEEDPLDNSIEYFLRHQLVTNEQIKRYKEYLEFRSQDEAAREKARFDLEYGDWTPSEIEAKINRLKNMLMERKKNKVGILSKWKKLKLIY